MNANDMKKGMIILFNKELHQVHETIHTKPGKGGAFMQTKLRNLERGSMIQHRFRSNETLDVPFIERKKFQYLYDEGSSFCFMDLEAYDQTFLTENDVGDAKNYLHPELEVELVFHEGRCVGLELPTTVNLKIIQTDPGLKGDTVTNHTKPATLESGLIVKVPLFINQDEVVRVDTRSGEFLGRAN